MKIEVGKFYRHRNGDKVGPISFYENSQFSDAVYTDGQWTYMVDGSWAGNHGGEHERDIVSEWIEKPLSPIRNVMRREVVEWKDDVLCVVPHECDLILVGFNHPGDQTYKSLNAEQCREAAHILNQIAEVLEENSK